MKICDTEALVLQTKDYGESDRLVDIYTKAGGRLRGIAKGARRSRKRFVHVFEMCSLVELTYRERKSLVWIDACKLVEPHLALRVEVERWVYASLICELVLEMAPEGEAEEELFLLLKDVFEHLSVDKDIVNVVVLFVLRFLHIMGYLPAMESCGVCQRPLRSAIRWGWRMSRGVLVCSEHRIAQHQYLTLDLGTLLLIQKLRCLPLDKIWRLRFQQGKKPYLLNGFLGWIRQHIGKDLNSLKMLEQLQTA